MNSDGSLNRSKLREIIFNHPQQKTYVENLLHPLILQQIEKQLEEMNSPYAIIEIPLLIEAGWQSKVDQVLVIDIPKKLQLQRLLKRDGLEEEKLVQIIDSQLSRSERAQYADQIIDNSKTQQEISQQILEIHQHYLQLADKQH